MIFLLKQRSIELSQSASFWYVNRNRGFTVRTGTEGSLQSRSKIKILFITLSPVLRIHSNLMRIRILDPHWKKYFRIRIEIMNILLRFTDFFNKAELSNYLSSFFSFIFLMNHSTGNFCNLSFFNTSDLGFENKKGFFPHFFIDILPLGSGDPLIFADPAPGS